MELWEYIKNRQLDGLRFRRQYGVGPYIVDFYCPKLRLAIEVDGDIHDLEEQAKKDRKRQKYIESTGIRILRFTNDQVMSHIELALSEIRKL